MSELVTQEHHESPVIAPCAGCGEPIHEQEPRVEDHRGLWHPEHYEAAPKRKTAPKRKG